MTPKDIFYHLTALAVGLMASSFFAALFADAAEPGSPLAQYSAVLFQWSTWALIGYAICAFGLLLTWGTWQAIVARHLFYVDGSRQAVVRREPNRTEDFAPLDLSLPDPRRGNLAWLDEEIHSILNEE